ncbi:MAG: four helix bundle protein [Prevotella sp.]|nr:four helix bundle protein [Prevotella sp.]
MQGFRWSYIAEGYRKIIQADKLRFMNISQGSLEECRYYCILSRDLGYMDLQEYEDLHSRANEVSFLLNAYIKGIAENKYKNSIE